MLQQFLDGVTEPGPFADLVSFYIEMETATKQKLLETLAIEERLRTLLVLVERQLALMDAQEDIQQQVQEELGERQREMLLREQLKAIQRELGEDGDGQEVQELRERIEALGWRSALGRRWSASWAGWSGRTRRAPSTR
jgi:ATP-dependent Lon protease